MKALYSLLALLLSVSIVSGQITFEIKDFPKPGTIDYYEGWSDSIDGGSAGASQVFDFSKALEGVEDTFIMDFLDPATTPFASSHPDATVAYISETEKDSATGTTTLELWEYIETSASKSEHDGITVNVDTGVMFSGSPPSAMISLHSDYGGDGMFIGAAYTYGANLSNEYWWSVMAGPLKHDESTSRTVEVDAWGTFSNPWFNNFDAIRFKVEEYRTGTDTIDGVQDDFWIDSTYYFEYWVKGLGYYAARLYTDSSYTDNRGFRLADHRTPSGISNAMQSADFTLYPNPAAHEVFIALNMSGKINYELHDINGKLIEQGGLKMVPSEASRIDLSKVEKGAYLLTLKSNNGLIGSRKIIVK